MKGVAAQQRAAFAAANRNFLLWKVIPCEGKKSVSLAITSSRSRTNAVCSNVAVPKRSSYVYTVLALAPSIIEEV